MGTVPGWTPGAKAQFGRNWAFSVSEQSGGRDSELVALSCLHHRPTGERNGYGNLLPARKPTEQELFQQRENHGRKNPKHDVVVIGATSMVDTCA